MERTTHDGAAVSPAAHDAARDLIVLFRRMRRRLRELPTAGLTPSQTSVLLRLDKDGASSTTVLATAEGVRPQSMTATLGALEELGLIQRRPDPEDGRRQIITLSDAGRTEVVGGRRARHNWLAHAIDQHLDEQQLRTVTDALRLLDQVIDG